ncbi:MAG TPA: metalloregulator ArsR/SmtB family transcription factor [bacterium]|nr:metalloregulator ArsR/SmtB family transcription factor [bacterium]HQI47900.1 metalloregulator ArsR/SmtB family transcription factor [bacterium]HQJ66336.1 metalloregulator ArsR/SmtB family transcription factor [bacterium]
MAEPVEVLKALSDHGRLRILKLLENKKLCVCEITELIGLATSTISSHLNVLKNAGLIKDEKEGKWINYRMAENPDPFFSELWPVISKKLDLDSVVAEDKLRGAGVDRLKICSSSKSVG